MNSNNPTQRTLDWQRIRLGNFTGSQIGDLFVKGRKKDEMFGQTALKYIYRIAYERLLSPDIVNDDMMFQYYIDNTNPSTRAMEWGTEQEGNARDLYESVTGKRMVEVSSVKHKTIRHFSSSPDGFYSGDDGEKGCLEIKCPSPSVFIQYLNEIKDNETLLSVEPKYFYQCQAHMACTKSKWCDFVIYNPFVVNPIHITRIYPDNDIFGEFKIRIREAEKIIKRIIKKIKK